MTAALIGSGTTIIAAVIAASIVMWQIGHGERLKLKLKLYEDFSALVDRTSTAATKLTSPTLSLMVQSREWAKAPESLAVIAPSQRARAFLELYSAVGERVVELIIAIERYEIIDTRLSVFRYALSAALHDLSEAWPAFADASWPLLPADEFDGDHPFAVQNWRRPPVPASQKLAAASQVVFECVNTLSSYLVDLQRELQNLLLTDLFKSRIAPREPLNPDVVVITLKDHESLKRHFDTTTAWGLRNQTAIDAAKEQFAKASIQPAEFG